MEAKNCAREKTHEYCSENAEVSGRNFLISYEEDKAEREREREREEVEKSKSIDKYVDEKS